MPDIITPDTFSGAFEMPASMTGRRVPQFTKEDLVRALLQAQAQPKSPYALQFEAPVITGGAPSREQQFQSDWDEAMARYQKMMSSPSSGVLPQGITYGGSQTLFTPETAMKQTLGPLRLQAAMFDPDVSRAFTQEAQAQHWMNLASQAVAREKRMQEYADERKAREARLQAESDLRRTKQKLPSSTDRNWLFEAKEDPAAWDKFDAIFGPGMAQSTIGNRYKDPRPTTPVTGGEMPQTPSFFNPANLWRNPELPPASNLSMASPEVFSTMPQAGTTLPGPPKLNEANMVMMVDKQGKQWQVPPDSVAKAEKTYGWKRQ